MAYRTRNMEKQRVAEEIKGFCANMDFNEEGFTCKGCRKTYIDPLQLKCHLQTNCHEKEKAKSAMSEFLHDYPEIIYIYTAPYDKSELGEECLVEELDLYYLICKLCHVSFSGLESAQDHVKSEKHITMKHGENSSQRQTEEFV